MPCMEWLPALGIITTGVTFDSENDRPGPSNLRGHFEAAQGCFLRQGFVLRLYNYSVA